jgi:hypothetical protein
MPSMPTGKTRGADVARVRQDRPQDYVKVVASTLPKDMDVRGSRATKVDALSDEELMAIALTAAPDRAGETR